MCQQIGLSRAAVYDKLSSTSPRFDPEFPRPIKLGSGAVGWIESEVQDWLQLCIKRSREML